MPNCNICSTPIKTKNGRCSSCHTDSHNDNVQNLDNVLTGGFDQKQRDFRNNLIKGRIAETLVQELFLSSNFNVYRYGMEHTMPGITELLSGIKTEVAAQIRKMPDFVVQKEKDVFFIEVKFRAKERFTILDLDSNYPYDNAYVILVSKCNIKCISVKELRVGIDISPDCSNYLVNRKEFKLDDDVVNEFRKFAGQFFANV